jgi:hypothetical protein
MAIGCETDEDKRRSRLWMRLRNSTYFVIRHGGHGRWNNNWRRDFSREGGMNMEGLEEKKENVLCI